MPAAPPEHKYREFISAVRIIFPPLRSLFILLGFTAIVSALLQLLVIGALATVAVQLAGTPRTSNEVLTSWTGMNVVLRFSTTSIALFGFIASVGLILVNGPLSSLQARIISHCSSSLRQQAISQYLKTDLNYRSLLREGYLQNLIGNLSQSNAAFAKNLCLALVSSVVILAFLIAPSFLNYKVAIIEISIILIALAVALSLNKWKPKTKPRLSSPENELAFLAAQASRMRNEIELYDAQTEVLAGMTDQISDAAKDRNRVEFAETFTPASVQYIFMAALFFALILVLNFLPGSHPSFSVGALLTVRLLTYLRSSAASAQRLAVLSPHVITFHSEVDRLSAHSNKDARQAGAEFDGVHLKDVRYGFKDHAPFIIDANLEIRRGEAIAIVGRSGSGKSTLCDLIAGMKVPTSGSITISDVSVHTLSSTTRTHVIGLVSQSSQLIRGTIEQNILFYRDDYSAGEVEAAAEAAHVDIDTAAFPLGLKTIIGPGVRELSGGQVQRIAIARALLGNPKLLILDEPSSALDECSEQLITDTFRALKGKVSLILVTHRRAPLALCDRVFRIEDGRLKEIDKIPEILSSNKFE